MTFAASPISGAEESEYSILFAKAHLNELLQICQTDECQFSNEQKSWLKLAQSLSQDLPEVIFKNKNDLGTKIFEKHSLESQVWINEDALLTGPEHNRIYTVSDGVLLWLDILFETKNITNNELAILEFELDGFLQEHVQSIVLNDSQAKDFTAVVWTQTTGSDQLFVRDQSFETFSVDDQIEHSNICPEVDQLSHLKIQSVQWSHSNLHETQNANLALTLDVNAHWKCASETKDGVIHIQLLSVRKKVFQILPESIQANIDLK